MRAGWGGWRGEVGERRLKRGGWWGGWRGEVGGEVGEGRLVGRLERGGWREEVGEGRLERGGWWGGWRGEVGEEVGEGRLVGRLEGNLGRRRGRLGGSMLGEVRVWWVKVWRKVGESLETKL